MESPRPSLATDPAPPLPLADAVRPLRQYVLLTGFALAVTLGQTVVVCALSGHTDPVAAYRALYRWDTTRYAYLVEQGYPDTLPEAQADMPKLGFFPGYPLFARAVTRLGGLTAADGTLLASQLASWGFWTYLLLFLQRWGAPASLGLAAATAILVHPCAFFLVAGYSESLFLVALLGFLYWRGVGGPTAWGLAALHGVAMTATRIVGLPLAVCPLLLTAADLWGSGLSGRDRLRRLAPAALLAAVAALGGLLFFGFCQLRYGRWDAYMYTQRLGWGVTPDYLAVLRPEVYRFDWPTFINGCVNPNDLSRLSVPLTALLFGLLALVECRLAKRDAGQGWRQRLGFYLCGGLMFYIALSGLANSYLISMIRYTFSVHVMLALAVVHLLARAPRPQGVVGGAAACLLLPAAGLSLCFEIMCVRLFTHWEWVA